MLDQLRRNSSCVISITVKPRLSVSVAWMADQEAYCAWSVAAGVTRSGSSRSAMNTAVDTRASRTRCA